MKIAIFSSWLPIVSHENKILAEKIGKYLAKKDVTIVTGGCSGIPAICIESAYAHNARTIGYFPHKNEHDYHDRQHEENTHDIKYYTTAHFIHGFTARSLEMIKNVDAAIILNGRIGTLSEFGIAIEEGLPIGIIEGTGGISEMVKDIMYIAQKNSSSAEIYFDTDYKKVIDHLIYNNKTTKTI
jgi:uncharacterized protein (TIGR00725 family)